MIKKFNLLFLTFCMIGKIKYAPGTVASLFTCFLFIVLINTFGYLVFFLITLIIFFYSFVAINNSFSEFKSEDPQEIVIDEVVGQMLPLLAIPVYETLNPLPLLYYCVFAFVSFRLFDIWKPFPISYVDNNVKGSLGIMLDDIVASVYSVVTITVILFFVGG
tara:strand:+ start:190 stop:675 length:486 start_codon:yes stop_codon:yes gene_type:complete